MFGLGESSSDTKSADSKTAAAKKAVTLSATDREKAVKKWNLFDPDANGKLDASQLGNVFVSMGYGEPSSDELKQLILSVDDSGDGAVTLDQFLSTLGATKLRVFLST